MKTVFIMLLLFSMAVLADGLKSVSPQAPITLPALPPVDNPTLPAIKLPLSPVKNVFHFTGIVIYVEELEGGFYGILSHYGEKYLPLDLPNEYRRSGLEIEVVAQFVEKEMTEKMWGRPIRLLSIRPKTE